MEKSEALKKGLCEYCCAWSDKKNKCLSLGDRCGLGDSMDDIDGFLERRRRTDVKKKGKK